MGRELSGNVTLTPGWSDRMQGKEDDKVEQFLNVKDLRRQTTANEEQLVILPLQTEITSLGILPIWNAHL